ncbi:MAG: hypothetical protein P8I51_09065 [Polaribacter sp.]|nr:hypothetical protein [Polaribacter sp.]MDG1955025.1 hypothetical protein [Polaribacter sp.]MDG2073949.1 hypothetical protein [Polaribacter sp.]
MHKKLAADLTSIAHNILQLKNKEDVLALKEKAYEVYEKLTVLAYVDEYLKDTPNATESKEELVEKIKNAAKEKVDDVVLEVVEEKQEDEITEVESITEKNEKIVEELLIDKEVVVVVETVAVEVKETIVEDFSTTLDVTKGEAAVNEIIEQPFDELEQTLFAAQTVVEEKVIKDKKAITLEEELDDTISVEVAADLFEKPEIKKSLNDQLQQNIQIGLNDRIAFVKNLFDGSQEEFNRVVSQLNTIKTEKEAKKFINKMVKPDYNWANQEEYEERFFALIERKFI